MKHFYDTGCDLLSYNYSLVVDAVDRVLVIISSDVLAVGGGVGREGVVKQMLATQCAFRLKEIPTHVTIVTELS